jgi:flagellar protein FliL
MAEKKFFIYIFVSVLITSIIVASGLFLYFKNPFEANASGELSVDELIEHTVATEEITTNLADEGFVRVEFNIQLDNKKAKEELEKRLFQLENAVIYELAGMTQKDIHGQEGISLLEKNIAKKVNEFLEKGEVVRVFTTQKIIQ